MARRKSYYGSFGSFEGLFNLFANSGAGWSLRLLDKNYAGNCIRVRRSLDSAEQDIGFLNNVLDQSALLSFVGANDGYIVIWYDQSGNSYDISNSVDSGQPRIVKAGVIETKNGTPAILFDGLVTTKYLDRVSISELDNGNSFSLFNVSNNRVAGNTGAILGINPINQLSSVRMFIDSRLTPNRNMSLSTTSGNFNVDLSTPYNNTDQVITTGILTGSNVSAYDNGNLGGSMSYTGTYTNSDFHVGYSHLSLGALDGNIQEMIMFSTDKTSEQSLIEANINTHYGVF